MCIRDRRKAVVEPPAAFADFADANFSADGGLALLRNHRKQVQLWQVSPWQPRSPLLDPGARASIDYVSWQLGPRVVEMCIRDRDFCRFRKLAAEFAGIDEDATGLHRGEWLEAIEQAHASLSRIDAKPHRFTPDPRASLFHIG